MCACVDMDLINQNRCTLGEDLKFKRLNEHGVFS